MKKFSFLFLMVVILCSINFASASVVVDKIVATVEGQPITAYELENIAGFYGTHNTKILIDRVINDYIVMYYAKKMGIIVTNEDINKYIDNIAKQNEMSPDMFLQKVNDSGIDIEYYKKGIRLGLYKKKFALKMFAPTIHITTKEIQRYYRLHKGEFKANPILIMSIISVKNKQLANTIYLKIKQGINFDFLKKKYSIDKENAKAIPLSAFNKNIRIQLSRLKVGDVSNIIEASGIYYIVKLVDKKGENVNFSAVKNKIEGILFTTKINAKLASWIKMVKSRTDIEIFE